MCVCVCACVCVCVCVCVRACVRACVHVCVCEDTDMRGWTTGETEKGMTRIKTEDSVTRDLEMTEVAR